MIVTVTLNGSIDRTLSVPNLRLGKTAKGTLLASVPAGKGVNVSRYLSIFATESVATGFVGRRELRLFEESFRGTAVTPMFIEVPGPTRIHTTIITDAETRETHIREEGFPVPAEKKLQLREMLFELASKHGPFVLSGSLPPDFSPAEFSDIIAGLRTRGASVVVDTSGTALHSAVAAEPDVLSPNDEELAELTGETLTTAAAAAEAARSLLANVPTVAVKRGRKGGVLVTRDEAFAASVEIDDSGVVNTVGAGDAFLAALLIAREAKMPLADQIARAVAAGGAGVLAGTVGALDPAVYEKLLAQVEVKPLEAPRARS